jgi:hypothetical protein
VALNRLAAAVGKGEDRTKVVALPEKPVSPEPKDLFAEHNNILV